MENSNGNENTISSARVSDGASRSTLYLTNIRSSQQQEIFDRIKQKKERNKGQKFRVKKQPPPFCKKKRIAYLDYQDNKLTKTRFGKIPCNSWTCPNCSMKKALQVKYLLRDIIVLNDLSYFLTLTLDPLKIPEEYKDNTHKYIAKIFKTIKEEKILSVQYKLPFAYLQNLNKTRDFEIWRREWDSPISLRSSVLTCSNPHSWSLTQLRLKLRRTNLSFAIY